jgi:hypothetical protein
MPSDWTDDLSDFDHDDDEAQLPPRVRLKEAMARARIMDFLNRERARKLMGAPESLFVKGMYLYARSVNGEVKVVKRLTADEHKLVQV